MDEDVEGQAVIAGRAAIVSGAGRRGRSPHRSSASRSNVTRLVVPST